MILLKKKSLISMCNVQLMNLVVLILLLSSFFFAFPQSTYAKQSYQEVIKKAQIEPVQPLKLAKFISDDVQCYGPIVFLPDLSGFSGLFDNLFVSTVIGESGQGQSLSCSYTLKLKLPKDQRITKASIGYRGAAFFEGQAEDMSASISTYAYLNRRRFQKEFHKIYLIDSLTNFYIQSDLEFQNNACEENVSVNINFVLNVKSTSSHPDDFVELFLDSIDFTDDIFSTMELNECFQGQ